MKGASGGEGEQEGSNWSINFSNILLHNNTEFGKKSQGYYREFTNFVHPTFLLMTISCN